MIIKERLQEIEELKIFQGNHKGFDEKKACIMEMVSYIAGEPWSDHPKCACPILTEYAIRINDRLNHEDRQKLKPLISMLVGTRLNDEAQISRKRLIRWRNVTVTYPFILDKIAAKEHAAAIRKFENTIPSMANAAKYLIDNQAAIKKIAYDNAYAYADAYDNASAYAYADAYAYANANAYAYAYADANAYDNQFRSDLADIAVETLRLAIAETGEKK